MEQTAAHVSSPEAPRYVNFTTLGAGSVRVGRELATKECLQALLCVDDELVIVDHDGNEVEPDAAGRYNFTESEYMAVSEKEVVEDAGEFLAECQQRVAAGQPLQPAEASKLQAMLVERRQRVDRMQQARRHLISSTYRPRHAALYTFSEDIFRDEFRVALTAATPDAYRAAVTQETPTGVYSMHAFTQTFCRQLLEEIENFSYSGLPVMRPNTMNNYGVVLDEMGLGPLMDAVRVRLRPLLAALYPTLGAGIDSQHAFAVQYAIGHDVELDFHFDDAELTLNVCLGDRFEGGDLYFRGLLDDPASHDENFVFRHEPGKGLFHQGKHRHGAQRITAGSRTNLIIWFRNSQLRNGLQCSCGGHGDHAGHDHATAANGHPDRSVMHNGQ
eukprot:TRINITY_DN18633_c0_g1_i1.p1 TRINITY_DN18633_c0_g1~~TRINITY_DN18633_c0_g1_i1.p1  ORF type:complete len:424 (+),score=117.56 TRINITY_DN18633_c0_g1_i1:113-1273(+)